MLILSRTPGESLTIGSDITVRILGVRGDRVRVGVEAPLSLAVHRPEVAKRLRRQAGPAAAGSFPEQAGGSQ